MNKQTEEIVLIAIVALVVLKMLGSSSASALGLAQVNAAQTVGLANAGASAIGSISGSLSDIFTQD